MIATKKGQSGLYRAFWRCGLLDCTRFALSTLSLLWRPEVTRLFVVCSTLLTWQRRTAWVSSWRGACSAFLSEGELQAWRWLTISRLCQLERAIAFSCSARVLASR